MNKTENKACNNDYPEGYQITREVLVREIRDAARWSAVQEATDALIRVRWKAEAMQKEYSYHVDYKEVK